MSPDPAPADRPPSARTGRSRPGGHLWHSWRRLRKLIALLPSSRFRRGLRHGVGAAIEHRTALAPLSTTRTVIDAGANRGQFALLVLDLFPLATVHAFEPTPKPLARLRAWSRGETRLVIHAVALGADEGEVEMHLSDSDDNSSLGRPTAAQLREFPATRTVGRMLVQLRRLDRVLTRADIRAPALLKIDVQGSELDVLAGCGDLLPRFDHVLVECSYIQFYEGQAPVDRIVTLLDAAGFNRVGVSHGMRGADGTVIQEDLLFARRNTARDP